ncbi:hypothetical protein T281_15135 [Rhodomicrobium udaipurense JA643]|nr:hypothetical protein T281_15135 [Rhodomicrobium udaipurense JA643]
MRTVKDVARNGVGNTSPLDLIFISFEPKIAGKCTQRDEPIRGITETLAHTQRHVFRPLFD